MKKAEEEVRPDYAVGEVKNKVECEVVLLRRRMLSQVLVRAAAKVLLILCTRDESWIQPYQNKQCSWLSVLHHHDSYMWINDLAGCWGWSELRTGFCVSRDQDLIDRAR